MALPVTLAIKEQMVKQIRLNYLRKSDAGRNYTFPYPSTSKIQYIIIDPHHQLPNIHPENNYFPISPAGTDANKVIKNYLTR
jgi:hypothetical protein